MNFYEYTETNPDPSKPPLRPTQTRNLEQNAKHTHSLSTVLIQIETCNSLSLIDTALLIQCEWTGGRVEI